jgi:hypothetical protein
MGTIGNSSSSYTQTNNADANYKRATRFLCPESGNVATVSLYCSCDSGGAGTWKAVIYADSAGSPGALSGTSAEVSTSAGSSRAWRTATFSSPVAVTAGSYYWIGFISGTGYLNYHVTSGTTGTGKYNADTYSGGAADPFGSATNLSPPTMLIYGTITPANSAPNAPTLTAPATGSSIEYLSQNTFRWTFSDPDSGDTQSAYTLRYKLTSAGSWTTLSEVISPSSSHTFAASTFAAGTYEWQVKTKDALGSEGPYSASSTFTAAATADVPVITAPSVDEVITAATYSVTWTHPDQDKYQVRTVADDGAGAPDTGTVYQDSTATTDTSARAYTIAFDTNGRTEHVQVRVETDASWSSWSSVKVSTNYAPPPTATVTLTADSSNGRIAVAGTYGELIADRNDFSTWTGTRASAVQAASTYSSTGSLAYKLVEDNTGANTHYLSKTITYAADTYTLQAWVLEDERDWVRLYMNDGTDTVYCDFDIDAGTAAVGTASGGTGTITASAGGYLLTLTSSSDMTGGEGTAAIYIGEADTDVTFDGAGSSPYTEADSGLYIGDVYLYPSDEAIPSTEDIYRATDASGTDSIRICADQPYKTTFYDYGCASGTDYYYLIRSKSAAGATADSTWTN